ncbi:phospholipid carrier-dependent glycosyltransferase [Gordonia sp. TBRC 11910]|uniref:Phospholipid carrier-dependent glycosyltransferase n=1 Tax=Gordonia asplenii TaxID=2725283 RepID=A0A848L1V3_9ACTN|nr:glycosyltransferase family 39 protein [Gordonia asplenii]NMO04776.1 phospholipid carrier-dependent glycosyltransferase [Gordonia asplenii]
MTLTIDPPTTPVQASSDAEPQLPPATRGTRLALAALLVATAVAYLWNITVNGMGNSFYAAAAQAGSSNWKALLFGSLDTGNFITVDKPPVSQWVMGLSGQIFGFSSASMLIPQALMAVAAVALTYAAVTRVTTSRNAGLLAGAALALIPVVALMFRFNNPDAVMVLLMTAGAYCTVRALPKASWKWLALAGVALGFAFLAKMLEGLMVVPALALAYLIVAPTGLGRRVVHLLGAVAALVVSSGWYVLLTLWWPADSRPYLAGSTDNNFMNLVIGYNGLSRVLGRNHGGGSHSGPTQAQIAEFMKENGGAHGFGGMSSSAGITRLFTGEVGFEISWLLPAALVGLVAVLISRGRAPRTDLMRGGAIVFGGWMVINGLVLSFMNGMMHAYYTLAIAPAIAGMIGIAAVEVWRRREQTWGHLGAAAMVLAAGGWGFVLLGRNGDWMPWLRWVILAATLVAVVALAFGALGGRWRTATVAIALFASLAGSTAYTVATIGTAHTGGSPSVGPAQSAHERGRGWDEAASNTQLDTLLRTAGTPWSAAVSRSSTAASMELSSKTAVMAIGGFGGSDPTPTLSQFQQYVKTGQVRYYVVAAQGGGHGRGGHGSGGRGGPGGFGGFGSKGPNTEIAAWVSANYTPQTVGSTVVYDLRAQ